MLYFNGRFWFLIKFFELFFVLSFVNLKDDKIVLDVIKVVRRVFVVSEDEFIILVNNDDEFEYLRIEFLSWVSICFIGVEIEDILRWVWWVLLFGNWVIFVFNLEVNIFVLCSMLINDVLICWRLEILLLLLDIEEFSMVELNFEEFFLRRVDSDWFVILMFFCKDFNFEFKFNVLVILLVWVWKFFKLVGRVDNVVVDKFMDFCVINDVDWFIFLKVFCSDFKFFKFVVVEVWFCIFVINEVEILVVFLINVVMDWLSDFMFFRMFFGLLYELIYVLRFFSDWFNCFVVCVVEFVLLRLFVVIGLFNLVLLLIL